LIRLRRFFDRVPVSTKGFTIAEAICRMHAHSQFNQIVTLVDVTSGDPQPGAARRRSLGSRRPSSAARLRRRVAPSARVRPRGRGRRDLRERGREPRADRPPRRARRQRRRRRSRVPAARRCRRRRRPRLLGRRGHAHAALARRRAGTPPFRQSWTTSRRHLFLPGAGASGPAPSLEGFGGTVRGAGERARL
jgi:hypothetical protein